MEIEVGFATVSDEVKKNPRVHKSTLNVLTDRQSLYTGICSNCDRLENCSYPSATADTWFCEEYVVKPAEPQIRTQPAYECDVTDSEEHVAGLCVNCDVRTSCTFPKPVGGVWFCAEYQ